MGYLRIFAVRITTFSFGEIITLHNILYLALRNESWVEYGLNTQSAFNLCELRNENNENAKRYRRGTSIVSPKYAFSVEFDTSAFARRRHYREWIFVFISPSFVKCTHVCLGHVASKSTEGARLHAKVVG